MTNFIFFTIGILTGYAIRTAKAIFEDKKMLEVIEANDERTMQKIRNLKMENSSLKTERSYLWNELQEMRRREHARTYDIPVVGGKNQNPSVKFGD